MGKGNKAKGATSKKRSPEAAAKKAAKASGSKGPSPGRIEKRKHVRAGDGKQRLVQKLQADAPKAAPSGALKQKRKRAANASALGAVAGMQGSLEELIAASEARVQERVAKSDEEAKSKKSLSSKRRQQLVADESLHMREVLAHPAFQANPFAALQEHLANTVTQPAAKERKGPKGGGRR